MTSEHVLDQAIDRIIAGDTAGLDELLAAYPDLRSEVEPLLDVVRQLNAAFPMQASQAFVVNTRRQLILRAAARRNAIQAPQSRWTRLRPRWLGPRLVYLGVSLLVVTSLLLSSGGWFVAQSLPGQPLYGAKRNAENAPLLVLTGSIARADYLLGLLERRVYELDVLVQWGRMNQLALAEVQSATEQALAAVQVIPLDQALPQWTRLETAATQECQLLAQASANGQVSLVLESHFSGAWRVCQDAKAQAEAMLSTLPPQVDATATVPGANPPGQTRTPQPPGQTRTPQPPGQTRTPQPPGLTRTPQPSPSNTAEPQPSPSNTSEPQPSPSNTAEPQPSPSGTPEPSKTPKPTNQPPGQTKTPQPPGQTKTPEPPGQTKTPKPTKTPK
ncbi:MAG: hypothetical protein KKB13_07495 [Chloroflexi bacterium]|nr:hypothetical protein [Chloroflexota bacterium]